MPDGAGSAIADNTILSNPATLQQWSNLVDSLFGKDQQTNSSEQTIGQTTGTTTSSTTSSNSSGADKQLMELITNLQSQMNQGGNSQQLQALLGPIFQQLQGTTLPGIQGQANAGGGVYNSTTQQLLKNDAWAKATAQGGGLVLQQQNALQTQLATLLAILAKSTQQTNSNTTGTNNSTQTGARQGSSNTQTSGNAANAAKAALGTAAAAKAAQAIKDLMKKSDDKGPGRSDDTDDTSGMPKWNGGQGNGRSDEQDNTSAMDTSRDGYLQGNDDPGAIDSIDAGNNLGFETPGSESNADFSFLDDIFGNGDNEPFIDSGNTEGSGDSPIDDFGDFGGTDGGDFGDFGGSDSEMEF